MTMIARIANETDAAPLPGVSAALDAPDRLRLVAGSSQLVLQVQYGDDCQRRLMLPGLPEPLLQPAIGAITEALSACDRDCRLIRLENAPSANLPFAECDGNELVVDPRAFWQWPHRWMPSAGYALPQVHVLTEGRYHPKRPAKPQGVVYRRHIPWLGQELTFRVADLEADLDCFHRWMNDKQVNLVWEDAGNLATHRRILEERRDDPHMLALIAALDGKTFGYFEVYWAKENRLGPFYEANDYDRGWHVAIGEPACRGKQFIAAWLPSLMHFMFLDEARTQRIVGEPSATHAQQIRNLDRSGFAKVKHFDFPHKRALLVTLTRERFFGDRLWTPAP
jgi:acetyl CoA:N6-hydroxylysine acetyl transferase